MTDYPDFTVIARLKGEYAGLEKAVALDSEGALQALLYGTYGGANKKVETDIDGNVRMNLYAQDLDDMVSRFKYGAPDNIQSSGSPTKNVLTELFSITGRGYIYSIHLWIDGAAHHDIDYIRPLVDGEQYPYPDNSWYNTWGYKEFVDGMIIVKQWDTVNFNYRFSIGSRWTFETSFALYYMRKVDDNVPIQYNVDYALV